MVSSHADQLHVNVDPLLLELPPLTPSQPSRSSQTTGSLPLLASSQAPGCTSASVKSGPSPRHIAGCRCRKVTLSVHGHCLEWPVTVLHRSGPPTAISHLAAPRISSPSLLLAAGPSRSTRSRHGILQTPIPHLDHLPPCVPTSASSCGWGRTAIPY